MKYCYNDMGVVMSTIPMNQVINVIPTVIAEGGSTLSFGAVVLTTQSSIVAAGTLVSYPNLAAVVSAFTSGNEVDIAKAYFTSWTNSTLKPASLAFFGVSNGGLG